MKPIDQLTGIVKYVVGAARPDEKLDIEIISKMIEENNYKDIFSQNDKLKLINSVNQSINTINIDLKKIQLAEEAVELQQKTVNIVTKKVRAGLSSGFELTTEQENLRTSKQALILAEIAYLTDLSSFDQTLGTTLDTWKIKVHY